ncbi:hypothetical protein H2199_007868 [Coniosporium tulheliwenetii]|uniref:Uncharacterized protein n=1 Tax=Coniosporium tulheliwenetii TaxID=3383036 RepID=A0ACC2YP62_9PEZI|nr:hypothetical protein H2199_007868 [Cladosporium sp. JES 115]
MAIPPARDTLAAMGIRYPLVELNYVLDTSEIHWTAIRDLLLEHIHGHIMQPHQVMPIPGQSAASVELHQSFDIGTHDDDSLPLTPTVQTADANRWRIRNDGPWGLRIEHCMTCESHERRCAHTFPCASCRALGLQCVGLIVYLDDDSTEFTNFVDAWIGFRRTHNLPIGDWGNPVPRPLGWHVSTAAQDFAEEQEATPQAPPQAQAAQSQALVAAAPAAAPTVAAGPAAGPASAPPVAGRSIPILTNLLPVAPARES